MREFKKKIRYPEDCKKIIKIMAGHGYRITMQQAQEAWEAYSASLAAGWMMLDENDDAVFRNAFSGMLDAGYEAVE